LSAALANVPDVLTITSRGHRQVFENFIGEANATLFLGSQVGAFQVRKDVMNHLTDFAPRSKVSNGTRMRMRGR
jgi:hypothetical protein